MYGHNHSNGWDDYLGGAAVYLAKGDNINIAQGSQTNYKEETLNFTYMNAGYTGYYNQENERGDITLPTGFASLGDASTVLTTAQGDLVKTGVTKTARQP